MTYNLRPCPVCGSPAQVVVDCENPDRFFTVLCSGFTCHNAWGADADWYETAEMAVEEWNNYCEGA